MDCRAFLDGYSDYDDSLLPPAEEAVFRAHLAECAACARYDRVLRKGRMLARQAVPEPSRDFLPRLQHRLLANPGPAPLPASPAVAGGFLTLMLAAVTGLWLFDDGAAVADARPLALAPSAGLQAATASAAVAAARRPVALPVTAQVGPPDWTGGGVDRSRPSSYSPLVIGPPAYRADRTVSTALAPTTSRTLD